MGVLGGSLLPRGWGGVGWGGEGGDLLPGVASFDRWKELGKCWEDRLGRWRAGGQTINSFQF